MTGAERIAEGQREEHLNGAQRAACVEQADKEHRLGGRLGPADRLAGAEGEIKRLGRELMRQAGDTAVSQRGFRRRRSRAPTSAARISAAGHRHLVGYLVSWHPANSRDRRVPMLRQPPTCRQLGRSSQRCHSK